ncbi:hypothetical protein D3C87_1146700 [compost metagenome]
MAHGFKHPVHVLLAIDRDNDDGARRFGHDPSSGFHTVHDRHDQVHQDQVRRLLGTLLHRFLAIARDPDHLMRRLESQGPAQGFHGHGHVVDDGDFHARAPPMSSTTASSRASS